MSYWEDEDNVYDDDLDDGEAFDDDDLDEDEKENRKSDSKIVCEYCGLKGHTSLDCPSIDD